MGNKMKFKDIVKCYIYNKFRPLNVIKDLNYKFHLDLPDDIKNNKDLDMYYTMMLLEGKTFLKKTNFKLSELIDAIEDKIKKSIIEAPFRDVDFNNLDYDKLIDIYTHATLIASTMEEIFRTLKHLDPDNNCKNCYYKDNCSVKKYLFETKNDMEVEDDDF